MGYLIQTDTGTINYFDPSYSNESGVISNSISPSSGYYLLNPETYNGSKWITLNCFIRFTVSAAGTGNVSMTLPKPSSGAFVSGVPFIATPLINNLQFLHYNAQWNSTTNLLDITFHFDRAVANEIAGLQITYLCTP